MKTNLLCLSLVVELSPLPLLSSRWRSSSTIGLTSSPPPRPWLLPLSGSPSPSGACRWPPNWRILLKWWWRSLGEAEALLGLGFWSIVVGAIRCRLPRAWAIAARRSAPSAWSKSTRCWNTSILCESESCPLPPPEDNIRLILRISQSPWQKSEAIATEMSTNLYGYNFILSSHYFKFCRFLDFRFYV